MKNSLITLSILLTTLPVIAAPIPFYIGTGGKNAEGIYRATFDPDTGKITEPVLAAEIGSPGWVVLNSDKTRLYSTSNDDKGSVAAFNVNEDGSLTLINKQPIGDGGAACLCLDNDDKILFSAQYGGGSTAAFPINEDGSIGERTALIEHEGSGPNKDRQKAPHPHWTGVSPDNRFLFVPDLGIDKVMTYEIDHDNATLKEHGFGQGVPGGGPRHMKFSPDGSKIYLLNELEMSVTVFDYDAEAGTMEAIQTIESCPEDIREVPSKSSEIRVHPSGKFVYAANRGHDTIAAYTVDPNTGELTFVEREAIRGSWPRNFNIDSTGQWLFCGGRYSNTISVFEIDQETGNIIFSGNIVNCPSPICLEF
ncbi:MAG: 3-carboxymuconate cyclase [Verrucomicrobiales bacterium]|nr:3-carboxymuconate cyclase [Verrucomicrobiales bacterium]